MSNIKFLPIASSLLSSTYITCLTHYSCLFTPQFYPERIAPKFGWNYTLYLKNSSSEENISSESKFLPQRWMNQILSFSANRSKNMDQEKHWKQSNLIRILLLKCRKFIKFILNFKRIGLYFSVFLRNNFKTFWFRKYKIIHTRMYFKGHKVCGLYHVQTCRNRALESQFT